MDAEAIRERAVEMPRQPGVYQFLDGDTVLYVGKAVDLRDRVRGYADPDRGTRIRRMVDRATAVETAVTDTETQALLLEANLVKRHQPRYNVRLKDDKSYPLIQLTDHDAPRIEVTRDPESDAVAFGPYTDVGRVETVVKALRQVHGVRGCSDAKFRDRDRPCLDHDLGLCSAPCTGEIAPEAYREDVAAVERFLNGETGVLAEPLQAAMERAAEREQFERAANLRDRLDAVRAFHGEGGDAVAGGEGGETTDVLGVAVEGDAATVARLHAEGGQLVDRSRHRLTTPDDAAEPTPAVLSAFLAQYYAERDLPDAVLVPEEPGDDEVETWLAAEGVDLRVPGAGREARLVDLALKNAHSAPDRTDDVAALGDALGIDRPERIEGFDVSHAQGRATVGSDVTFVDGEPERGDYRRKKLPDGNDDYANLQTLVRWRAERAVEGRDDRPDPDLLLIDGGEGQRRAAREALDAVGWSVPVVALAKDEERVVTADGVADWADDAPQRHLLQRVRDEAHRFAVAYHQTVRDEVSTVLEELPGVGPALRRRLLRRFGSVDEVRAASEAELRDVPGIGDETAETLTSRL
ncbi:MAG: excinuclease ABC subunit C [Halobacteriaceae archaeon]